MCINEKYADAAPSVHAETSSCPCSPLFPFMLNSSSLKTTCSSLIFLCTDCYNNQIEVFLSDFDGVQFHISNPDGEKSKLRVRCLNVYITLLLTASASFLLSEKQRVVPQNTHTSPTEGIFL